MLIKISKPSHNLNLNCLDNQLDCCIFEPMFRSILSFCLALVYLLLSLGAIAQVHYCGSKVSSIGLYQKEVAGCACTILSKSDCCHEATVDFSFETQSTITNSTKTPNPIDCLQLGVIYVAGNQLPLLYKTITLKANWHPPQHLLLPLLATWRI